MACPIISLGHNTPYQATARIILALFFLFVKRLNELFLIFFTQIKIGGFLHRLFVYFTL
jgi:hypothetical protein